MLCVKNYTFSRKIEEINKRDMNSYKFTLKDYKAIKEAEIDLNGITVLAGENGAGKSTITRWMYYLVEVISEFEWYAYEELRNDLFSILSDYRMATFDARINDNGIAASVNKWRLQFSQIDFNEEDAVLRQIEEAKDIIVKVADFVANNISKRNRLGYRFMRLMTYWEINDIEHFDRDSFIERHVGRIDEVYNDYVTKVQDRSLGYLYEYVRQHHDDSYRLPVSNSIQLYEDKVPILEKKIFGHLFGLNRAIYVDTPMSIGAEAFDNQRWRNLSELLEKRDNVSLTPEMKKMLLRIQRIIHGSIKNKADDFDDEIRYVREDKLDIPLMEAATGIKSFAYIIRLLENGFLNKNTLLIIDEPEAHLHPQWVVEFAHVLVLLTKELGVRVLIASHNPDMVAAIQSIGEKEGLKDAITFYQAYPTEENKFEYKYKNLGFEISEIFQSFNIALSRIKDYGKFAD